MRIKILEKFKERKNNKLCEKYLKAIENEVDQIMKSEGLLKINQDGKKIPVRGSCHRRWAIEKRIIKERYGMDYKTPQERRPNWRFW